MSQLCVKFDRKNVRADVKKAVNADRQFLDLITDGFVILAAMEDKKMTDIDDTPQDFGSNVDLKSYFENVCDSIVDKFVFKYKDPSQILLQEEPPRHPPPAVDATGDHQYSEAEGLFLCGFPGCRVTFASNGLARSRHRMFCQFKEVDCSELNEEALCNDSKFNYTCQLLFKGLLDRLRVDASREGDGFRSYMLWKHDFPQLVTKKHTNYSLLTFRFVAQMEALLSENEAKSMVYNRYVNMHGGLGHNIPDDLAMEFMNKEAKPHLQHAPTLTTQVFERAGKSLKVCRSVRDTVTLKSLH